MDMALRTFFVGCSLSLAFPQYLSAGNENNEPTIATVGIFLTQIDNINVKEQTFDAEFYLWIDWAGKNSPENYEFVNGKSITKSFHVITSDSSGQSLSVKIRGTFRSNLDVSRYPRDNHVLRIEMENFDWIAKSLVYDMDISNTGMPEELNLGEWKAKYIGPEVSKSTFGPAGDMFSHYEFSVSIQRLLAPFVIKIFIPLLIVVAMSMLTFFIPPAEFEAQAGIGVTAVLSIIAFHFTIGGELPEVGYLTSADKLMMGSYVFIFLALVESVLANTLYRIKKEALSKRIDRMCRLIFPLFYLIFLFVLII